MSRLESWLSERRTTEVECLVPDISGVARGKILPTSKFLKSQTDNSLRLPESIFSQTVTGEFIDSEVTDPTEPDVILRPDPDTLCVVPWYEDPTAQVINDCVYRDGRPVSIAPRQVLRRVIDLYAAKGWRAIVAPELEFYLCAKNVDPDYPLQPPIGRSGRAETGSQSYGIDAVNEFDPIFEDVYRFCEAQELDVDTLIHEAGRAQCEINFNHADPMSMADQAFMFKRTVRQAAMKHGVYATFMAKPYSQEPGSAMHIHQSVVDIKTGRNLFSDAEGNDTPLFHAHIAGLQKHLSAAMPLIAPNVNSYRRLTRFMSAPINLHWGRENRTTGLRVPESAPDGRRVENRVPGADANPYLVIAASLACGYIGMVNELEPTDPITNSAYRLKFALPRYLPDALNKLKGSDDLSEVLGEEFVTLLMEVKQAEHDAYQQVISAWEREHLLLNV
ncbi:glutamine synthetase [Oleomonas cavernae]|uniref:Glutamine synthetase n=1 Tax=Oleomonas cavernae TaxID=2320859 RepID=A0A418WFD2_9PROT|nr:glutamine synthetase family protein [Oleomonas cavernae]RJF88692.1 glutamine synthetase [Oleomonas cavernae]